MQLGIDMVEVSRIQQAIERSQRFTVRVYTPNEIEYARGKGVHQYETFAGIYAVKEACVKALGVGMRFGSFQDMEVIHDVYGAPQLVLRNNFLSIFKDKGFTDITMSISHTDSLAMAQVIMY